MANVQMELELLEIPRSGFSNHRLKMTRALSDQVLRDFRSREHRYFKACKDYDDCDGHTRGSSRIGVGSIVLIHVPQPVGHCGNFTAHGRNFTRFSRHFPIIRTCILCAKKMIAGDGVTSQGQSTRFRDSG